MPDTGNALWGRWDLVGISVVVHAIFLLFFIGGSFAKPRSVDFRSKGILVGFIVALYFEMYGIPLTVFLLQPVLPNLFADFYPVAFPLRFAGSVLIFAGFVIIYLGWKKIHSAGDRLVKTGIYSHIRHPQYVGLLLLTFGQMVQWPTLTGMALWPFLAAVYYRLARKEERDMLNLFGKEYEQYCSNVPRFFPKIRFTSPWMKKQKTIQ